MSEREFYRRHLPHWQPPGAAVFLTWRLYGSSPKTVRPMKDGKDFVEFDDLLDHPSNGPLWLQDPRIARLVMEALHHGQDVLHFYDLKAWVILANHVHVLIQPHTELAKITKSLKGYTSYGANCILGRQGQPFWQAESFDHWIRDAAEERKIIRYIENNPVKAGLVSKSEEWLWSSRGQAGMPALHHL